MSVCEKLTFSEMFSGVGGFRLGLERSGWVCVWANDNDKYANKIYKKKFGDSELVEGDVREVDTRKIPSHTLLTAGFPCQAFSVAGKRKATKEARGTLFTHIVRVASAKKPKLLLLENVKGILSSDSGRTFAIILRALDGLGYDVEWQVLNSKHFGVPQNRERVFIIGHLRGTSTKQIFPIGKTSQDTSRTQRKTRSEGSRIRVANPLCVGGSGRERNLIAKSALIQSQGREPHIEARKDDLSHSLKGKGGWEGNYIIANTLSSRYLKEGSKNLVQVGVLGKDSQATRVYDPKGIARTVKFGGGLGAKTGLYTVMEHKKITERTGKYGVGFKQEESFCLDSSCGRDLTIHHPNTRIRRLTPTECERLQGFPDGWTEGVSDTQRYKLLGNAVTVNVIEFLGFQLRQILKEGKKR